MEQPPAVPEAPTEVPVPIAADVLGATVTCDATGAVVSIGRASSSQTYTVLVDGEFETEVVTTAGAGAGVHVGQSAGETNLIEIVDNVGAPVTGASVSCVEATVLPPLGSGDVVLAQPAPAEPAPTALAVTGVESGQLTVTALALIAGGMMLAAGGLTARRRSLR